MPGNHQKLGWPGMHSPSLPSGYTLVWTSGPQNWKRLHFHCLRPSICGPLLDYKFPWAGPGPPSVQMCEGSPGIGLWESCFGPQPVSWLPPLPSPLRLSCHPSHPTTRPIMARNCSPSPTSPSLRAQLHQARALASSTPCFSTGHPTPSLALLPSQLSPCSPGPLVFAYLGFHPACLETIHLG